MSTVGDHYIELWGEPSREAEFEILGHEIEVYKWDADANPEEVVMYATVGASASPTPGSPSHRNEFYVGLLPEHDAMAAPLAMQNVPLGGGGQ
jgi:hypothetical protein